MTLGEKVKRVAAYIWTNIFRFLVALAVLLFAIFIVRPLETVPDPTGDDVGAAWNESISRLGIIPVYPPSEDVGVGDIWAIIADSDQTPLLGKAVRIDHLDLRKQILAAAQQPTFPETAIPAAGASYAKQERYETDPADPRFSERIPLSLTAFPGITINHTLHSGASAGSGGSGWFGARREEGQHEEIRLKRTETYGLSTIDAIFVLNAWCQAEKTKILCDDRHVRQILSFAVGDQVLQTKDKKYTSTLGLQLVTRVFLAREIEQQRYNDSASGGGAQTGADPSAGPVSQSEGTTSKNDDDARRVAALNDNVAKALVAGAAAGAKLSIGRSDGLGLSLSQTFQRPVVFGYRAVTIRLEQSQPSEKSPP
jgi:hypothetical protein